MEQEKSQRKVDINIYYQAIINTEQWDTISKEFIKLGISNFTSVENFPTELLQEFEIDKITLDNYKESLNVSLNKVLKIVKEEPEKAYRIMNYLFKYKRDELFAKNV